LAPLSPEAASTVCPWTAASSKSVFSACAAEEPSFASQSPHDVEMTLAALSATIAAYVA
jgi:FlaG/FlaF family flagellin (archaellin)